jgi:hypothetical protein
MAMITKEQMLAAYEESIDKLLDIRERHPHEYCYTTPIIHGDAGDICEIEVAWRPHE